MGTFIGYYGDDKIVEDKREEFIKNVKRILKYGGMVQLDNVKMFGKDIGLMNPPIENEDGKILFHYNIFEDDFWETACFDTNKLDFYTGKVGSYEFNKVCSTIYILTEFYVKDFGLASENSYIYNATEYIAWLNYILGTNFTNKRALNAWKIYESVRDEYHNDQTMNLVFNDSTDANAIDIAGLMTYAYVTRKHNSTWDELKNNLGETKNNNNFINIYTCVDRLTIIVKEIKNDISFEELKNILLNDDKLKESIQGKDKLSSFSFFSLLIPKVIGLKILCEVYAKDFWKNYEKEKELLKNASGVIFDREIQELQPIKPITTPEFLYISDYSLAFFRTKAKTNYHISNDDLGYFWTEDGDIKFSNEYIEWIKYLKEKYKKILELDNNISNEDFLKTMIDTLYEINNTFKRVYAYKDMFYEFLTNNTKKEYRAMLTLMKEILEEEREKEEEIMTNINWELTDRNITFNPTRVKMKRFLALLANKELRNKVFGF